MRRTVWRVAVATFLASAMAACAGGTTGGEDGDQIVLTAWVNKIDGDAVKKMYEDFSRDNPKYDISIELRWTAPEEFVPRWNAGERPDIIEWHVSRGFMAQIQPAQTLLPLTDEEFVDKVQFDLYDYEGAVDGTPYFTVTAYPTIHGMWYNKPLMGELGLKVPKNAQELLQLCKDVREARPELTPIYVGGGDKWPFYLIPQMFWANAIADGAVDRVNQGDAKIAGDEWLEPLEFNAYDMTDAGCFNDKDLLTSTFPDQQTAVFEGEALMIPQTSVIMPILTETYGKEAVDKNIGFFPLSFKDDTLTWSAQPLGAWAASKTGNKEREEGALEFLRYATSKGYQDVLNATGALPVLNGFERPDNVPQALLDASAIFEEKGGQPAFEAAMLVSPGDFGTQMSKVFAGQSKPEDVLKDMQKNFERAASAMGLEGY